MNVKMCIGVSKEYFESVVGTEITDEMLNDFNTSDNFWECLLSGEIEYIDGYIKHWYCLNCTEEGKLREYHRIECARLNGFVESSEESDYHRNEFHRLDMLLIKMADDM